MREYRKDIDGLRAIAVLPVVFSHAGLPGFSGGFIGVDIFFVISGFLITGILIREVEERNFSLLRFYERRARRILPALFAVLATCLLIGYAVLPPSLYEGLAKSTIATVFFGSNLWFLHSTGDYFGTAAEYEPLLHTWSLAVEEQFYILIPLLIWGLSFWGRKAIVMSIAAIVAVSFCLSVWATQAAPLFNFFMTPTRAWELGVGSLLALGVVPQTQRRIIVEAAAALGLAAICASILLLSSKTPFPGLAALPACIGSAAIIWAGGQGSTATGRLLSTRGAVGIGLISYSLYLWHWPPLVLARLWGGQVHIDLPVTLAVIALSIVLAWASWRYIEQPFRAGKGTTRFGTRAVFALSGIGALGVLVGCALILQTDGARWRIPNTIMEPFEQAHSRSSIEMDCRQTACVLGAAEGANTPPDVLIWGDSHAAALLPGFDLWLRSAGITGTARVKNACAPIMGVIRLDKPRSHDCAGFNSKTLDFLRQTPSISTVVLVGRWALAVSGDRAQGEAGPSARLGRVGTQGTQSAGNREIFAQGLEDTLRQLNALGKQVILFEGIPELGFNAPQAYLNASFLGAPLPPTPTRAAYSARNAAVVEVLDTISVAYPTVERINPADYMCTPDCLVEVDGILLYRDEDHLSVAGAKRIVPPLFQ